MHYFSVLLIFAMGLIGGILFYLLHLPLPWTLGPLTTVLAYKVSSKRQVRWPAGIRNFSLLILGVVMGSPFTMATARQIVEQLPAIAAATLITVAFSLFMGYVTHKRGGIDLASSLLGSVPGGLSQMVLLSQEVSKADTTIVTFMQSTRLLATIFVVPFLALHGLAGTVDVTARKIISYGAVDPGSMIFFGFVVLLGTAAAICLGLPTPWMLGPILSTATLVCFGAEPLPLPGWLIAAAQISTGIYMGSNIEVDNLPNWRNLLWYTLSGVAGILSCSFLIGFALQLFCGYSLVTAFLGTAPGGVAEMGLTAMMVHADLSVVIAYQMFRLLFILLVVPLVLKWLLKKI